MNKTQEKNPENKINVILKCHLDFFSFTSTLIFLFLSLLQDNLMGEKSPSIRNGLEIKEERRKCWWLAFFLHLRFLPHRVSLGKWKEKRLALFGNIQQVLSLTSLKDVLFHKNFCALVCHLSGCFFLCFPCRISETILTKVVKWH